MNVLVKEIWRLYWGEQYLVLLIVVIVNVEVSLIFLFIILYCFVCSWLENFKFIIQIKT